jgi:RNA-directed DNA polymerase
LRPVARAIAVAFLSGDAEPGAMAARASEAIGDELGDWLLPLAEELAGATGGRGVEAVELIELILRCDHFTHQAEDERWEGWQVPWEDELVVRAPSEVPERWTRGVPAALIAPVEPYEVAEVTGGGPTPSTPSTRAWAVPPIADIVELGEHLGLHVQHVRWYADQRGMERDAPDEALRHYTYRWIPKRSGGGRLLEMPKPMLRFFQRRILHEILDPIPLHAAAHGFRRGRSVATFAAPHAGHPTVIRLDLESFFASVSAARVVGIFRTAGYPDPVARSLAGMVTNTVPFAVRRTAPGPRVDDDGRHRRHLTQLGHPHLPQGAPTSPAIANLAAFGLDRRLGGLAATYSATYTRYADDLAFSGGHRLGRHQLQLVERVRRIVVAEGFRVNDAKTRVRTAGERQAVAGLVVNDHPQVPREEYDRLRAVLHDASVNGPAAANRAGHPDFRSHLLGRIGWVATGSSTRAAKLQRQFAAIEW